MRRLARVVLLVGVGLLAQAQGIIRTLAGTDWNFPSPTLPALSAPLGNVHRLAVSGSGDLYIADRQNHMIFRVTSAGVLSIVAGNGVEGFSGDNGLATSAALSQPSGVAVDAAGNLYIADSANHRIRKVAGGIISTIAGTAGFGFNADGIPATSATLFAPTDVAVNATGDVFIADNGNDRVRRIDGATGLISTFAGTGVGGFSGDGGPAASARITEPSGLFVDTANRVYIASSRHVRRVNANGVIETIAGIEDYLPATDNEPAIATSLGVPEDVAVDAAGNVYIADSRQYRVRRVGANGIITTVAGTDEAGYSGEGGPGTAANLNAPVGVAVDGQGNVFIADTLNRRVRRVGANGVIATFAGNNGFKFGGDGGPAAAGLLQDPAGVARDAEGNLYVADRQNHRVRKVSAAGVISTVAGDGFGRFSGDGGAATNASLDTPVGVALDAAGNLYIGDSGNDRVRKVDRATGVISTFAGGGVADAPGQATQVKLDFPGYLAFDKAGNLYVAQAFNIFKITPAGALTVFAGNGQAASTGNGGLATAASILYAGGIVADSAGNIYLAEQFHGTVRRITGDGKINAFAGVPELGCCSGDDGPALQAGLGATSLAVDQEDTLYIGALGRVRKVKAGVISTVAGGVTPNQGSSFGDGGSALQADLSDVDGVAVDTQGNVYLTDAQHDRVRQVLNAAPPFSVSRTLLTFAAKSGGLRPASEVIAVTSSITNLPYQVTYAANGGDWLGVEPPFGLAPGLVEVSADPAGIGPGEYEGTISIFSPDANPPLRVVNVKFSVAPADAPTLAVDSASLVFDLVEKQPGDSQQLVVSNNGSGSIAFTVEVGTTTGGGWLTASAADGTSTTRGPSTINIRAQPGQLSPGTYAGLITVSAAALNQRVLIPVTMVVHAATQTMLLSREGVFFTAAVGSTAPLTDSIGVVNTGLGSMNWSAKAETTSGGNWLSLSPATGASGPGGSFVPYVDIRAVPTGLTPGDYYGRITVEAPGATNSPQTVSVVLRVTTADELAIPDVRPTGLLFVGRPGEVIASQDVLVTNVGAGATTFRSTRSADAGPVFFTHQPADGSLPVGRPTRITVQASATGLSPGVHRGSITLETANGDTRIIETALVVPNVTGPAGATRSAAGCTPTKLVLVFTLLGQQFQVPASFPAAIELKVVDDCGDPLETGYVRLRFSNGDAPLSLVATGRGFWSATWQVGRNEADLRVVATAESADGKLTGTTETSGDIRANQAGPVVLSGSIVNGASFALNAPVAPGTIITIFGERLSAGVAESSSPRPTQLNGTLVALGGVALPLLYVSPGQVNAIVPYGLTPNTTQQVVVANGNALTTPFPIPVAPAQPAVFTVSGNGHGQGHVYRLDGLLADANNPVVGGDVIVIYCAGLGAVDAAVSIGEPAPSVPVARTVQPVELTIGGVQAEVLFAGLTPTYTGLYQINARVPAGVASGNAVPLVISTVGQFSPPVVIAVK